MKKILLIAATALFAPLTAWAATGKAEIKPTSPDFVLSGAAAFEETPNGLKVTADIRNAPPGKHGFHIHEFGSCGDAGNSAGGHFNPDGKPHGDAAKSGPAHAHPGDMGNIAVGPDGIGILEIILPDVTLVGGHTNVAGKAVILHQKEDDFGQPTGNAGGRIGCGIIAVNL